MLNCSTFVHARGQSLLCGQQCRNAESTMQPVRASLNKQLYIITAFVRIRYRLAAHRQRLSTGWRFITSGFSIDRTCARRGTGSGSSWTSCGTRSRAATAPHSWPSSTASSRARRTSRNASPSETSLSVSGRSRLVFLASGRVGRLSVCSSYGS